MPTKKCLAAAAQEHAMKLGPCLDVVSAFRRACDWEVRARKIGNVHDEAAFVDMSAADLRRSAAVAAPLLQEVGRRGVGPTVLAAVRRRRRVTPVNTNLGILLLTVPLAAVPRPVGVHGAAWLRRGVRGVLRRLSVADAVAVYQAIRLARPGGLGRVARADVNSRPRLTLLSAMKLAARRDGVARQYANGFADLWRTGLPALRFALRRGWPLEEAILLCQLRLLARLGDSLIARKCGRAVSRQLRRRATAVLAAGWPATGRSQRLLARLDHWLRAEGHRRNPGTTADLVTATLFAAGRCGLLPSSDASFRSPRILVSC